MKQTCYGYIFARGGSKGVPRKNVRLLGDKPLIAHSIDALWFSSCVDRIIVSTEDEEIASVARLYGAETPFMRPVELAQDASPELDAWRHALEEAKKEGMLPDVLVSAPATSPFRQPRDIVEGMELFNAGGADLVIAVTETNHNPYFNMVTLGDKNKAQLVLSPEKGVFRRQDAPAVYNITTLVYITTPEYVFDCKSLMEGRVRALVVPESRALDIDTMMDFEFAEFLIAKRGLS